MIAARKLSYLAENINFYMARNIYADDLRVYIHCTLHGLADYEILVEARTRLLRNKKRQPIQQESSHQRTWVAIFQEFVSINILCEKPALHGALDAQLLGVVSSDDRAEQQRKQQSKAKGLHFS